MKTLSKKVVSLLIALAMLISIAPASMAEDLFIIQWGTQYHLKDGASNLSGTIFDVEDLANKVFAGRPSGFAIGGWYIDENYTTTWNGSNDSGNIYAYTNVADNQSTYEALLKGTASGLYANKFGTILIRGTQSGSTSSFNQTSAITMNASRTVTLKSYYSGGASIRLLNLTNTWHIIATGNANVIDITFIDVQLRGHNSGGISNGTTGTNGSTVNLRGNNTIPGFANISECRGSGIYNNRTLNLYGNIKIANNNAPNGGGVYSIGTFNMYDDALISNNTATLGGGVYNSIIGSTFKMYDNSSINGNTASDSGGGVYNNSARIDMYDSASISNNTATNNGGGIWTHASNLGNITAAVDVVFEGNSASAGACLMTNSSDITLHNSRILTKTRSLSIPFRYTYNNYDISYTSGTLIKGSMPQVPSVFGMPFTYHLKDGTNTITNTSTNPTVQVYQGRPEGFDIGAWFTDSSYTTLWNGTDVTPLYAYSNVADDHATFQGLIKGTASGAYRADNGLFSTVLVRGTPQSGDKSSFNLTSAITLGNDDAGRNVTFKSYYSGGAHIITAISARHFDISIIAANKISFTFVDVQLQGRNPSNVGGGVIHRLGTLNLKGANTIEGFANIANCRNVTGGGLDNRYTVNLRGNMAISNNVSTGVGGGVYVGSSVNDYSTLNMYDTSKISGNEALKNNGGGVHIVNGRVNMYDSSAISGNTSTLDQYFQGEYVGGNGGGVHINSISPGTLYMYDNSTISNNFAEADGGGVWTPNLLNVTAASGTTFAGNTAGNGAYLIQYVLGMLSSANAGDIAIHGTRIFTDTVSPPKPPFEYAYNNYDINYKKGDLWNSSGHTPAPTAIPTSAPTAGSTSVPTSLPTATPTSVPSPASTLLPTQTPSSVPSPASTLAPTLLPTQAPTSVPSPRPTLEPGATERPTPISWGDTTTNGGDATEGDGNGEGQIVVEGVGSIDVSGLEDRIYDGTYHCPLPHIVLEGGTVLIEDIDYTLRYEDNREVGQAKCFVTFIDNYSGTCLITFNILPGATLQPTSTPTNTPTSVPTSSPTSTPTSSPTSTPTNTPTSAPTSLPTSTPTSSPTSNPTSVPTTPISTPTSTPTNSPTSSPTSMPTSNPTSAPGATSAPTAGPTTSVPASSAPSAAPTSKPIDWGNTTTNGGSGTEGDGNGKGGVDVNGAGSIGVSGLEDRIYTGTAQTPKPHIVMENGTVLVEGTDYTLAYKDNIEVGTATCTITFIGSHTGTCVITFNILPGLIKDDHFAYIKGYEDGEFRPQQNMNRAEVAIMFSRLMVQKMNINFTPKGIFSDVKPGDWFAKEIEFLAGFGIIKGYDEAGGGKYFDPFGAITRAEFAAIASRFDSLSKANGVSFSDVPPNHWAYDSIMSAAAKGWITGYNEAGGGKYFGPQSNITRAEVVTLVNRMLERRFDSKFDRTNMIIPGDVQSNFWAFGDILETMNAHDYVKDEDGNETWTKLR